MWGLVPYLAGMAIVGVGMVLARLGYRQRERRSQLVTTPPTVPGSVTERGVVEFEGEVVPAPDAPTRTVEPDADGTFAAPDGGRAVLVAWRARDDAGVSGRIGFPQRAAGYLSVPFYVADGDGRVLVDPGTGTVEGADAVDVSGLGATVTANGATIDAGATTDHPGGSLPAPFDTLARDLPALRGALAGVGGDSGPGRDPGPVSAGFATATIAPGDRVYVRGYARRDTGSAGGSSTLVGSGDAARFAVEDAVVTHTPPEEGPFVLSTREKASLLEAIGGGQRLYLGGIVVALTGLVVMLVGSGVVGGL
jgi:hypothetical protein